MKLKLIQEGSAKIFVPDSETGMNCLKKPFVFYNPKMEIERDLSILAFQCYQKQTNKNLEICDSMTGSGVRGIRYTLEIHGVNRVTLNDLNPLAVKLAKRNVILNDIDDKIIVKCQDANDLMNVRTKSKKRCDIIDVDPFGSPSSYIDSAVRALRNRGLIALTATDLAPLCGVRPVACQRKYGGRPLRTEYSHEIGARLLIGCLVSVAAKNELAVKILLCHHALHYLRVYAVIYHSIQSTNDCLKNMGYIAHCFGCLNREVIYELKKFKTYCKICGSKFSFAGPLWLGELFDKDFCSLMINESKERKFQRKEAEKLLRKILVEKQNIQTFFVVDRICSKMKIKTLSLKRILGEIISKGYKVSTTHFHQTGFRTDANIYELESILKEL